MKNLFTITPDVLAWGEGPFIVAEWAAAIMFAAFALTVVACLVFLIVVVIKK